MPFVSSLEIWRERSVLLQGSVDLAVRRSLESSGSMAYMPGNSRRVIGIGAALAVSAHGQSVLRSHILSETLRLIPQELALSAA